MPAELVKPAIMLVSGNRIFKPWPSSAQLAGAVPFAKGVHARQCGTMGSNGVDAVE